MIWLALRMLTGDAAKHLGIVTAVAFASLLMTQQAAMFCGIMRQSYGTVDAVPAADLWVTSPETRFIDDVVPISDTAAQRVRGVPGVAWAAPYFHGSMRARLASGRQEDCAVVGVDAATLIGGPTEMRAGRVADLREPDAVVVDELAASDKLATRHADGTVSPLAIGDTLEMDDVRVRVVGICAARPLWTGEALVYTTYPRAVSMMRSERRSMAYVLAGVRAGADADEVAGRVRASTGLAAYPPDGFRERTLDFVLTRTGLAVSFGVAVLLAAAIGTVIAGQSFWSFTLGNLRFFAVLKAMGVGHRRIVAMVAAQACWVAAIGYGIGIGLTALSVHAVGQSELSLHLPWQLLAASLVAVVAVCLAASVVSVVRVLRLEPGEVFR